MKNLNVAFLLLLCFALLNCRRPSEKQYLTKDDLIEMIANEAPDGYFPSFSGYDLFGAPNERSEISWADTRDLRYVYNHRDAHWEYLTYPDFVESFFKGTRLSSYGPSIDNVFVLNDTVKWVYENNAFEIFMEHYATKSEDRDREGFRINRDLSENSLLSVLFYAFQNDYIGYFHDIIGWYYVEKMPVSSLKQEEAGSLPDEEAQTIIRKILKKR